MKKIFMVMIASMMVSGSAFAQVATDASCSVGYKGVDSFATCVDGKLFSRPEADMKSSVELSYVSSMVIYADFKRNEACDAGYIGANEMYGCK